MVGLQCSLFIIFAVGLFQSNALKVGFSETDYKALEGAGGVKTVIIKEDETLEELVITVTPLTYEQFRLRPELILPDVLMEREIDPDPAEFEPIPGRQDFDNNVLTVRFPPSTIIRKQQQDLFIPFKDDFINENNEGFYLVLRVVNSSSDEAATVSYVRNGVALIIIGNDDPITISFERPEYQVAETAGLLPQLIRIIKENDVITERSLEVFVAYSEKTARKGIDFQEKDGKFLTFAPEMQELFLPFKVIDDNITENDEELNAFLSTPKGQDYLVGISLANIIIKDNDAATIGFEQEEYDVIESDGSVEVCVVVQQPEQIELIIFVQLSSIDETTTEFNAAVDSDYTAVNQLILLSQGARRQCFNISITSDDILESVEHFRIALDTNILDVNVDPDRATIKIIPDPIEDTCDRCPTNAHCLTSEGENRCACNNGYTGDGLTCSDINECLTRTDNCNANSVCRNTQGSFTCRCQRGFTRSGNQCRDINECTRRTDNCNANSVCRNTPGSFTCRCKRGFTRSGNQCRDINECTRRTHNCNANSVCRNTEGSFTCRCKRGFVRSGNQCRDINECSLGRDNCDTNARCINIPGSFTCRCNYGFVGNGRQCIRRATRPIAVPTQTTPTVISEPMIDCDDMDETSHRSRSRNTRTRSRNTRTRSRSTSRCQTTSSRSSRRSRGSRRSQGSRRSRG